MDERLSGYRFQYEYENVALTICFSVIDELCHFNTATSAGGVLRSAAINLPISDKSLTRIEILTTYISTEFLCEVIGVIR